MIEVEMTEREYLRSLGFEVGERGRLSIEMKRSLENSGKKFSQVKKAVMMPEFIKQEIKASFIPKPKMRESTELHGYTAEGYKVGFVMCFDCSLHMSYCACEGGIKAPSVVKISSDPLVKV